MNKKKGAIANQHRLACAANPVSQPQNRSRRFISHLFTFSAGLLALVYAAQKWFSKAEITHYWTRLISWPLFNWLAHPSWVVTPLMLIIVFPLLINLPRNPAQITKQITVILWGHPLNWQIWISRIAAIALLVYLFLISPTLSSLATASLTWFVPVDSGAPADAIVVLSRGETATGQRYEAAAQLWQNQRAPQIFVTTQNNFTHMEELLQQKQIPIGVLGGTQCAMTTYDEALSSAAILGLQGVENIILMTDPPHMLRSLLTFRGMGFSVTPHITPLPAEMSSAERSLLALREYPGLLSYALLGRFNQQSRDLKQPPAKTLQEIERRKCQLPKLE
jgi:uncharacterized SAM-binding protein YcdF (DUF218 family)